MKTKNLVLSVTVCVFAIAITFSSCKKKEDKTDESGQASTDSRQAISENDASINDINQTISDYPLLNGRTAGTTQVNSICGLTVDTNGAHLGTVKLNYNGTVCNNRKRNGSVRLKIINYTSGQRWKMAGCEMEVEYIGYRVTRASDGEFVELNGTQILKNISGGTWWELLIGTQPNLSSSVTGTNLSVNFNGVGTANYNIHRRFTYTWANSVLTCTGEGIGTSNGISNLENYGTTRDGDGFTSQVVSPIVWNTTCGWAAPLSGNLVVKVASKDFDLNCFFGVNSSGSSVTVGSNQCPYGWNLTWTAGTYSQNKVIKYY